eukprot:scaffold7298_cov150-Skeletonema_menzelii.AAC.1
MFINMISSRTACHFQSTNAHHQYFVATLALQTLQQPSKSHNYFIRHNCVASSSSSSFFHRCKHTVRRTRSSSIWSLQAQQDDSNIPSRKRRRRARDVVTNNNDDDITDNVTSLLFKPVAIPFSISSNKSRKLMPAIFPLVLIATFAALPPITSTLVIIFFGAYLALLLPLLDEYDDISLEENDEQDSDMLVAAPAAAYLGAVASAALLSPQGLLVSPEDVRVLSLNSVPYLLAVLTVGFGGYVLFTGVNETAKDTREWEIEEMDSIPERKERYVMKQWDDELKEKEDGLN